MSLYIDKKYVSLIAPKLERFQQKKDYLWTFRCPECGDSKKNKHKTRGYFYRKKENLSFICHNCHASMSLGTFLKSLDPLIYREYQLERYKEESHSNVKQPDFALARERPVFAVNKGVITLPRICDLDDSHVAKLYVLSRKLPQYTHARLHFAEDFTAFVKDTFPEYDVSRLQTSGDARLVIPFFDEKVSLLGVQGRSLDPKSKVRYITIKSSDDALKLYGLNTVDFSKSVYVVEGPLDSLFLNNAIATMDAALYKVIDLLGKEHDYIFVYDREPRNSDVLRCMEKTIAMNQKICIWPKTITGKDINEMVLADVDVQKVIDDNIFQGPRAKLEFEMWRKV